MTLLIAAFAAVIFTLIWYAKGADNGYLLSVPCFFFWGAALMWLVDAVFEYIEAGAAYFTPEPSDMLNDAFLGLSVVALGMVIWVVILLIKDPKEEIRKALFGKKNK